MSLNTASIELSNALKSLHVLWDEARTGWTDSVRQDFEARHWDPLQAQARAAIQPMERLAPILARAQRECS